jgi:hypothetical protein
MAGGTIPPKQRPNNIAVIVLLCGNVDFRAVPSPDFVTAYWRRRDRVEELAYKVFKKYLP